MRSPYSIIQASRQRRQQALHPDHPAVLPLDADAPLKPVNPEKRAAFRRKLVELADPESSKSQSKCNTEERQGPDPDPSCPMEAPRLEPSPRRRERSTLEPTASKWKDPSIEQRRNNSTQPPYSNLESRVNHHASTSTSEKRSNFLPIAMPRPDPPEDDDELENKPSFDAPANIQVPVPSGATDDAKTEISDLSYTSEFASQNTLAIASAYRGTSSVENPLLPSRMDRSQFKIFKDNVHDFNRLTKVDEGSPGSHSHNRSAGSWGGVLDKMEQPTSVTPPPQSDRSSRKEEEQRDDVPSGSSRVEEGNFSSASSQNNGRDGPPNEVANVVKDEGNRNDSRSQAKMEKPPTNRAYPNQSPMKTGLRTQGPRDPGEGDGRSGAIIQGPPTPRKKCEDVYSPPKEKPGVMDLEEEDLSTVFAGLTEPILTPTLPSQDSLARSRDSTTFFSSLGPGGSPRVLPGSTPANARQQQKPPQETRDDDETNDETLFGVAFLQAETRDSQDTGSGKGPCYHWSKSLKYIKTVAEDIGTQIQNIQSMVSENDMDGMIEALTKELKKAKESTPERRDELVRFLGEELEKTGCSVDRTKADNDWVAPSEDVLNPNKQKTAQEPKQEIPRRKPLEDFDARIPAR